MSASSSASQPASPAASRPYSHEHEHEHEQGSGRSRKPWLVLLAAVVVALITARLGWWQLDRAAQKNALHAAMAQQQALPPLGLAELARDEAGAAEQYHRAVRLQGAWLPQQTVYLENRQMNARVGFYAITPLLLTDGTAVLVQRGWWPRDLLDRSKVLAPAAPAGPVQLLGRIAPSPSRLYEFDAQAQGVIRQNLEVSAFASERNLPLRPLTVVQLDAQPAPNDGLMREWPQPASDVHKHYGYAFQWFSLSLLSLGLYLWFQWWRPRRASRTALAAQSPGPPHDQA